MKGINSNSYCAVIKVLLSERADVKESQNYEFVVYRYLCGGPRGFCFSTRQRLYACNLVREINSCNKLRAALPAPSRSQYVHSYFPLLQLRRDEYRIKLCGIGSAPSCCT